MRDRKENLINDEELDNISGGIGGTIRTDEDNRYKKRYITMECPACGQPVDIDATVCEHCGNVIPAGIREEALANNKWRI